MKFFVIGILFFTISFSSCNSTTSQENSFVKKIEIAHQKKIFFESQAVKFDLNLEFGGKKRLNATITSSTHSEYAIIELKNGGKILINKDKVYCSPDLVENKKIRFDAYTWTYFFQFAYKLSDFGTIWTDYNDQNNLNFNTKKLSFEANIGDAPDDWYILFSDKKNNLIDHVAYIVTANKTKEQAEVDPHAIQYLDYKNINGVPIAHQWIFWEWRKKEGLTKQLGNGKISNVQFVDMSSKELKIPENYIEK